VLSPIPEHLESDRVLGFESESKSESRGLESESESSGFESESESESSK